MGIRSTRSSTAASASVRVRGKDSVLVVEVSDDGAGGASLGAGTGLRGLADRVDVLGGTMTLESPVGSGTLLRVRLPCA
jgi:signal transduction histidine kinase